MAKKTSVSITGFKQARESLEKFVRRQFQEPNVLEPIAVLASDQIKKRTRGRQEEYAQDEISKATKKRRKSLIKSGNAFNARVSKPNQSNLSLSGQLLESIRSKLQTAQSTIVLYLFNPRKPYKGVKGQDLENKKTNTQIKSDLDALDRRFLFISDKLKIQLENKLAQILRTKLSLYNKILRKLNR